ncbi:hypothetical protein KCMC57_up56860 [Kitasatospora sp. CMC57]|uniref:Endoglucanase B carbohydrate binding domain-containing protein n=1 Tax=Kitasatospora sp. CMC57 TaxID=3231513 RepID=A0AB33K956_9ACTN
MRDRNLVATVQYYSWYPFSLNIANGTTYGATSQKDLTEGFRRVHDTLVAKGIPVYLGECGLLTSPYSGRVERGEMLKYFEHVNYEARRNGMTTAICDAYDKPVLSDATGTAAGLTIPNRFNGELMAHVESTYADGTAAGPASWTTFQSFDNYRAGYGADTTTVKADFLKSLKDDAPVTLTFRFWIGATATYHAIKSGTTVTGTVS